MTIDRRLLRYSVRSLLLSTASIAAGLGWYEETIWPQQRAVNEIVQAGGFVSYDVLPKSNALNCIPRWRSVHGDDSHFWLDCRHHVLTAFASDAGDPHELCRRLVELPKLHTLGLSGTRFNDEDLEPISTMAEMFDLDLGQTSVTDQGVQKLARLSKLELLELPSTISGAALEQLQKALPQCTITRLRAAQAH